MDWKINKQVTLDGVSLEVGDELLREGQMKEATSMADLLELKVPAKLVFHRKTSRPSSQTLKIDKEGHVATETKTLSETEKHTKTVKTTHTSWSKNTSNLSHSTEITRPVAIWTKKELKALIEVMNKGFVVTKSVHIGSTLLE